MPKITKQELQRERDRLSRESSLYQMALHCLVFQREDYVTGFEYDGETFTFRLFRATGPAGGIVIQTQIGSDNSHSVTAYYLEDMSQWSAVQHPATEYTYKVRDAYSKLVSARSQLLMV